MPIKAKNIKSQKNKVGYQHKRNARKYNNSQKVNNTLLNKNRVKGDSKKGI